MQKCPLVSICVISYNSAATIVETLDSAAAQTYRNIELVVSDDGSRDDTLLIIERWVANNRGRFTDIKIVTAQKNTGITPNCNRAWRAASGEWIKMIAADDIMLPHMVQTYIEYAREHPEDRLLFSPIEIFGDGVLRDGWTTLWADKERVFRALPNAKEQYKYLSSKGNFVPAVSNFINVAVLHSLKGFDEDILFMEDLPFWLNATKNGYTLKIVGSNPLVRYRANDSSIQSTGRRFLITFLLYQSKYIIYNPFYRICQREIDQVDINSNRSKFFFYLLFFGALPHKVINKIIRIIIK
ncbi:Glycosyl transferase group 2 family protein [Mucinivorans hirudinis]|uniref:Glycosyl transferase group 2 family protein n=1 Tax=Mucinivorans hirudinis TaxID=1433126 RepID=A0A060REL7_9BACT|nr:Glycosyl transferase group 2 family protein [Mucinivorans hirudinis]